MIRVFAALNHNYRLIKEAERTIQEMAEVKGCYLYLNNPDGTRIRIQPGCTIESYEIKALIHEKEE